MKSLDMRPLKTIMVCLDLTEMDEVLLHYAHFLISLLGEVEQVLFVHNIQIEYPEDAEEIMEGLDRPLEEAIAGLIREKVGSGWNGTPGPDWEVVVENDASTVRSLTTLADRYEVQLTITGKKRSYAGSGLLAESLVRTAHFHSDLLLVPETAHYQISKIVVPTDFSNASLAAIRFGALLRDRSGAALDCQHVFGVPAHYFPYIPVEDMQQRLRTSAEKSWAKFSRHWQGDDFDPLTCNFTFNQGKSTAQTIYRHALQQKKDLIIVGSKGKGAFTTLVIGSVAASLMQYDMHIPLLVTR